jgi:hypothetical protein
VASLARSLQQSCERYGLIAECAAEKTRGPNVDLHVEVYDECNTVIDFKRVIRNICTVGVCRFGRRTVASNAPIGLYQIIKWLPPTDSQVCYEKDRERIAKESELICS